MLLTGHVSSANDAACDLWTYYIKHSNANPNAAFYDIKAYFQGYKTSKSGKDMMNSESDDFKYTELLSALREAMKQLGKHIEPKLYEYCFLIK